MRIESVETKLYRIPPTTKWEDATFRINGIELVLTEVTTDNGITGVGWSYTVGSGGTSVKAFIDDYLGPLVIGEDPHRVQGIWEKLWSETKCIGTGSLSIAPIDIALWDILAKKSQLPLYKLLGGAKEKIMAYASGINLGYTKDQLLEEVNSYLEKGYNGVKIKVGKEDPLEDVDRVEAVRKLIGPYRLLLVDANQVWTVGEAIQRTAMLEKYNLFWMEEPMIANDIEGHVQLRESVQTPIAIGENLWDKYGVVEYLRNNACDIVQADVARVGGITEWMKVAAITQGRNIPMAPHFLMEISVSVLCAIPNSLILENVTGGSFTEMGILDEDIQPVNGYMSPPNEPGHGVKFNKDKLLQYEMTPEKMKGLDLSTRKG